MLVDSVEDLAGPLIILAPDSAKRRRLAQGGQSYLRERLTMEAVLPQFNAIVAQVLRDCPTGVGEV